jgi:hypothetical protein
MKKYSIIAIITFYVLLSGCVSVPMASIDRDNTAKQFRPVLDKSNIYLYRNESYGGAVTMPVTLDGKIAGKTAAKTYFKWTVKPGKHTITSLTENTAKIELDTKPNKNYFIWQEVKMGMWTARSQLHEVPRTKGENGVLECKLAETDIK